jgi:diacylglycerol kinase family enzyme
VQVFDLSKHKPNEVLETMWRNFDEHDAAEREQRGKAGKGAQDSSQDEGDMTTAAKMRGRLRVVAAGGDGTVAWVLQVRAHI